MTYAPRILALDLASRTGWACGDQSDARGRAWPGARHLLHFAARPPYAVQGGAMTSAPRLDPCGLALLLPEDSLPAAQVFPPLRRGRQRILFDARHDGLLSLRRPERRNPANIDLAFGMPRIISRLHAKPRLHASAKQFGDARRDLRRQWLCFIEKIVKLLARNTELIGDFGLRLRNIDKDVSDNRAGMARATVLVADGLVLSHRRVPSMVLLQIDAEGVTVFEFEGDAPWPVDVNAIAGGVEASQRMKVIADVIEIVGRSDGIQSIKPHRNSFLQFAVDLSRVPPRPQLPKPLVSKRLDHSRSVRELLTDCKRVLA